MITVNMDGRFSVYGMEGVAFWIKGYADEEFVIAVMVGDDREHVFHVDDLKEISDEDYCASCGQIGCTHDGR